MFRNPVMFTVEIGTAVMLAVCIWIIYRRKIAGKFGLQHHYYQYSIRHFIVCQFCGSHCRSKRKSTGRQFAQNKRRNTGQRELQLVGEIFTNEVKIVPSSQLQKGDIFLCEAGDIIPMDGEIIKGIATIDETAITGESAPVIREAGGDKSSVTGGTKVLADQNNSAVTTEPGESFLDKMIALVEGATVKKLPMKLH